MEVVNCKIGIMDPNSFSFRWTLEGLFRYLNLEIKYEGKLHKITTERVKCKAYDTLNTSTDFKAVLNRGAHWNPQQDSYLAIVSRKTYFINNMNSFKSICKNTAYAQMHELGLTIPATWAIPQKDYSEWLKEGNISPDLIFPEHELFNLDEIGEKVGYPAFLKPQAGGGWVGVKRVENVKELHKAYDESGDKPVNLQKAIDYREFCRTVGIGPQMMPMHYNASAKYSHDRYLRSATKAIEHNFLTKEEEKEVKQVCKIINAFYCWDHNSCEALVAKDGKIYLIDFANAYPDSKLASLHYYFPEVVKGMVKWLTFAAVTGRKNILGFGHHWHKFYDTLEQATRENWTYNQKLDKYEELADEYFETKHFEEFCKECLPDFDERAYSYFSSKEFDDIIVEECQRYFKIAQEVPAKIAHYRGIHHFWLHCEKERLGL